MRYFIILAFSLLSIYIGSAQISKTAEPIWKHGVDYPKSNIDYKEVNSGNYLLLYDTQINVPKETFYNRITKKITDNVGIQDASTINISYDPSYQKLIFHKIDIIRNNEVIDKLDISNIQEMRRELNAENYLYDGTLSAVMNLSDVRTDDIIDFSYSIIGVNPIHQGVFSTNLYLNDLEDVGLVNITIFSANKLNFKTFNNAPEPTVSQTNNLITYNWKVNNPTKVDYEEYTAAWKMIYDSVFISEFNSWAEVVNWGIDVFKLETDLSLDLQNKISEINNKYDTYEEKVKATLDFVQNEIRYLGLESGIGSYKPFSPNKVFAQRFGDCKDKSLLMSTMLNHMGIEAYPMLVNTYLKHNIEELLPSPKFFDHCVIKVIANSVSKYYDPTISNQGGDYYSTHFPDYRYGLVLKKGNDAFDKINPYSENKVETFEEYTIDTIGKGATLKVTTIYHEGEADNMRNYFKNNSTNSIKKEFEGFYSNYYFNVTSSKDPIIDDQKYHNVFKVFEEYQIDSIWQPVPERINNIGVNFVPGSLLNSLYVPTKTNRNSELSIIYPILREHHIKINLPTEWGIQNEKLFVTSPAFYYEWKVNYDRKNHVIDLYYYLKTLKDHIDTSEYKQYIVDVKKVDHSTGYNIFIPKDYKPAINSQANNSALIFFNALKFLIKIVLVIAVLVAAGLFIYWFVQKRKET